MSKSIRMESLTLKPMDGKNFNIHYDKEKNIQFEEPLKITNNSVGAIMNISAEGRLKSQNQQRPEGPLKKAGTTSERSQFEDDGLDSRNFVRVNTGGKWDWCDGMNIYETMKMDEPDTYVKYMELRNKSIECGGWGENRTKESLEYKMEATKVYWDWYERRCIGADGYARNPVGGQRTALLALQEQHSDSKHDTTFGIYNEKFPDVDSELWKIRTKFNVLLPSNLLKALGKLENVDKLSDSEKQDLNTKLEKVNSVVDKLKETEINYEGTHVFLRFGAIIDDDGNVTYHANYTGCENKNGIRAESTEELLKMLMEK